MKTCALVFLLVFSGALTAYAEEIALLTYPVQILQGDAVLMQIPNLNDVKDVKSVTFDGSALAPYLYNGKVSALFPIALTKKAGTYRLEVVLNNGETIDKDVLIRARYKEEESLGVPTKLGGTTATSTKKLISALSVENAKLAKIKSIKKSLWSGPFILPLSNAVVTDPYGISRNTAGYTITHLGTDLRAATPTPVLAMNTGIVRTASFNKPYGNTIVIDHGFGLLTMYMHLSKIKVNVGEKVWQKQVIGLTGDTGYAEGPHLHVSVRIGTTSVDPMDFLQLFAFSSTSKTIVQ